MELQIFAEFRTFIFWSDNASNIKNGALLFQFFYPSSTLFHRAKFIYCNY
jgi:hypothetical protein